MNEIKVYEFGQIAQTNDYSMFKRLMGNRKVDNNRLAKIRKSIEEVGYIPVPLVVNENMEVIDGQARLIVFEEYSLPVNYMIVPGLGFDDCIAMNISGTNWHQIDYIEAFAQNGNSNYVRILELIKRNPDVTLTNIMCASTGLMTSSSASVKTGTIEVSEGQYFKACELLDYVTKVLPLINGIGKSKNYFANALMFAYQCESVDPEKMVHQIANYSHKLGSFGDTESCLDALSEVYNFKSRGDRVYLATEYKKVMNERYPWYESKWGNRQ